MMSSGENIEVGVLRGAKVATRLDRIKDNRLAKTKDPNHRPVKFTGEKHWWTGVKYNRMLNKTLGYTGSYKTELTIKLLNKATNHPDKLKKGLDAIWRKLRDVTNGKYVACLEYGEVGDVSPHYHIMVDHIFTNSEKEILRKNLQSKMIWRLHIQEILKESDCVDYFCKFAKGAIKMKPFDHKATGWEHIDFTPFILGSGIKNNQGYLTKVKYDLEVLELFGMDRYNLLYLNKIPIKPESVGKAHITMDDLDLSKIKNYYSAFQIGKRMVLNELKKGTNMDSSKIQNVAIRDIYINIYRRIDSEISVADLNRTMEDHLEIVCFQILKNVSHNLQSPPEPDWNWQDELPPMI